MVDRIRRIICNYVDIDPGEIDEKTNIMEYGLTSLDLINIIADCESEFGIIIPERDIQLLLTIEDMLVYLQVRISSETQKS